MGYDELISQAAMVGWGLSLGTTWTVLILSAHAYHSHYHKASLGGSVFGLLFAINTLAAAHIVWWAVIVAGFYAGLTICTIVWFCWEEYQSNKIMRGK